MREREWEGERKREVNGEGEVQRDAVTMWSKLAGMEMVGLMSRKAEKQKSIANKGKKQEGKEVENIKVYRRKIYVSTI